MKVIQVFLRGAERCEISAELEWYFVKENHVHIRSREDDTTTEHIIPLDNVGFIRIFDEKD